MRVLIVRIGAMGDVLHALPAVSALRERMPDCFIGWAIEPRWRELLVAEPAWEGQSKPLVDRVHSVPTREWSRRPFSLSTLRSILDLRRALRAERYDICVDLQGSIRSSVVGWMSGATLLVGPANPREDPARWLYGRRVATSSAHVIEQACEILGAATGEYLEPDVPPLPMQLASELWWGEFAASFPPQTRFVVIAPTAGWGAKEWPAERYQQVAAALTGHGFTVLVNAASGADPVPQRVAEGGAARVVACNLAQMVAMIRRTELVIGGDTGPVHLAAALLTPVLALYGPTEPARTGPYSSNSRVLRHRSSTVDHHRLREPEAGLAQITSGEVIRAAFELLGEEHDG